MCYTNTLQRCTLYIYVHYIYTTHTHYIYVCVCVRFENTMVGPMVRPSLEVGRSIRASSYAVTRMVVVLLI